MFFFCWLLECETKILKTQKTIELKQNFQNISKTS